MSGNSLADKVIEANEFEDNDISSTAPYPNVWGVDEYGFHWPNPVNAQAVAAAVFFRHGMKDNIDSIFKTEDGVFIERKKMKKDKNTLLALFDNPKIVIWANQDPGLQDREKLWKQIKGIISSEYPIVWGFITQIAPKYNRDYIRITKGLVWDKNNADILFM